MEIVSGKLRGLSLQPPKGYEARPTSVRARQALFDSLGPLDGLMVADLFAGTGAIGLEAASRGASHVLFADSSRASCGIIRTNCGKADKIAETARFDIVTGSLPNCCRRLASHAKPDLIFADPPYAESGTLLTGLLGNEDFTQWASNARLIWEVPSKGGMPPPPSPWKLENIREFGGVRFFFFQIQ